MMRLADVNDPLLRAKSLLAQEFPMHVVAHQVGLPIRRLRTFALRFHWLRRTRREAYSATIRAEVLCEYARTQSLIQTARMFGIDRQTLRRWIKQAAPTPIPTPITWRCYDCAPYGLRVEGNTCPSCGSVRAWGKDEDADAA